MKIERANDLIELVESDHLLPAVLENFRHCRNCTLRRLSIVLFDRIIPPEP